MPGDQANVDGANIYEPDEPDEPDLLADAVRRAIRATRITRVPEADRAKAASLITDAAALLEADVFDGPHCQVGFDLAGTGFESGIAPHQYFAYSPVIGARNPLAPPVRFTVEPDKSIRGEVTLTEAYNGPPWNLAHGGVIAMIFDELLGVATIENHGGGFTGRLTIHYRKPTPILEPLVLRGWVDHQDGRKAIAKGEMIVAATGVVTAEADGLFISVGGPLLANDDAPVAPPP